MVERLTGIVASQGLAIGPAYIFEKEKVDVVKTEIAETDVDAHQEKLKGAFAHYLKELESRTSGSEEEVAVVRAHIELLSDPYFIETALTKVRANRVSCDWALRETVDEMAAMIESLDDPYLRERAADYRDIGQQVLYALRGIDAADLSDLTEDCIIISEELTPSDTSTMNKQHVLGFANDQGGKTSHTSIIAQTLGIPALVGMQRVTGRVKQGDVLILDALDAQNGCLIINPEEETLQAYRKKMQALEEEKAHLEEVKNLEAVTRDGHHVEVACNMGNLEDLDRGLSYGADGVGLFRTEFLYMENTHFPTEEEQFVVYKAAAKKLGSRALLIRTLDIGGDKGLSYYEFPKEENPFLGWRALRVCFDKEDVFRDQIRAILRASAFGNVKFLLPMVISVEEIQRVQERIAQYKEELRKEGKAFNESVDVGIMVETPASAILAEELIRYCDYFSIGTNDLTQYVLAVDRGNERITNLYNTYHPAVLRSIARVIRASHEAGKWTGMCGGFAGDTDATYLLLGMGLDEFSAPAAKVPKVKDLIRTANFEEARAFAENVLACGTLREVEKLIEENAHR